MIKLAHLFTSKAIKESEPVLVSSIGYTKSAESCLAFPDDSGESTTMYSLDADGVVQLCVNNVSFIGVGYDFPERTIDSLQQRR